MRISDIAYAKSQISAFNAAADFRQRVPVSVNDRDKPKKRLSVAKDLVELGFTIHVDRRHLPEAKGVRGIACERLYKLARTERRPNVLDMMKNGEIAFIINSPSGQASREDEVKIRSTAISMKISHATNLAAAEACVKAMRSLRDQELTVKTLQEFHS